MLRRENIIDHYIYLFLVDPVRSETKDKLGTFSGKYEAFVAREPGYSTNLLKAFNLAFQTPKDGRLSHELIKETHKTAIAHIPNSKIMSNQDDPMAFAFSIQSPNDFFEYRQTGTSFRIADMSHQINKFVCTVSKKGLEEFADYWYEHKQAPMHTLKIFLDKNRYHQIFANQGKMMFAGHDGREETIPKDISNKKAAELLKQYAADSKFTHIEVTPSYSLMRSSACAAMIKKEMDIIFESYHRMIANAQNEDEKIRVIMQHLQRIDQLHPYYDGNIRTCYVLMMKLFRDNNIPYAILLDPNRLDGCSVDELVAMVKHGQALYQKVANANNLDGIVHPLNLNNEVASEVKFQPVQLKDVKDQTIIAQFVSSLTKTENVELKVPTQLNTHSLFKSDQGNTSSINPILVELHTKVKDAIIGNVETKAVSDMLKTILDDKVDAALRKCCSVNQPKAIKAILAYKDQLTFSVNAKSTNGNTALDWLTANTVMSAKDKAEIKELLLKASEEELKRNALKQ